VIRNLSDECSVSLRFEYENYWKLGRSSSRKHVIADLIRNPPEEYTGSFCFNGAEFAALSQAPRMWTVRKVEFICC
jgi:hypothetical protein